MGEAHSSGTGRKPRATKAKDVVPDAPRAARPIVVEQWKLEKLKPFARNSRTHSPDQVGAIAKSIQRFGFTNPILAADDGTIIAGHGRALAAKSLGLETVPVIIASDWSENERRAYVIADNKLALDAGWDEDVLKLELGELAEAGFDLDFTGFKEDDLNSLFGEADLNEPTPPDVKPVFQVLIDCGTEAEQLELIEEMQARGVDCRALIA
jgi:ParB-like chromosome segregation protein Spo0J